MLTRIIIYFLLTFFVFYCFPIKLSNADTELGYLSPSLFLLVDKNSYLDPERLIIDVVIKPEGQLINAANILLSFSFNKLSLTSINKENSFCSFFLKEKVDNAKGKYNLICGTPLPFASEKLVVARLIFKKEASGWAKIYVAENSSLHAHNGQGNNILGNRELHNIYIMK